MKREDSVENLQSSLIGAITKRSFDHDEADHLIERRARDKSPKDLANERAALWKQSVVEYQAEKDEALRYQWVSYFRTLGRNHAELSEHFEGKALSLVKLPDHDPRARELLAELC